MYAFKERESLILWVVVSAASQQQMSAHRAKGLEFDPPCGYHILYQNHYLLPHRRMLCTRATVCSVAAVDLSSHNPSPLGSLSFQQWVISSAESETGERGAGKGGSFRVQGSLASPRPPLFSFLTVSPEHMTRLNPKPQPIYVGLSPQSHLSLWWSVFLLWLSNFVRSHCYMSLHSAWRISLLPWLYLLKTAHMTLSCSSSFFTLLMWVSRRAISRLVGTLWSKRFCLFHQVLFVWFFLKLNTWVVGLWLWPDLYTLSVQYKPITSIFCVCTDMF